MPTAITQLRSLAKTCQAWQDKHGLSDADLVRKVSQLGSTKTYKKILDPDDPLDDLNLERQLANYQAAVTYLETMPVPDTGPERRYRDFRNIEKSLAAVRRAKGEESLMRLVVIQGETGTGKDAVKDTIIAEFPNITVEVEATDLWRGSLNNALGEIIAALGIIRRGKNSQLPNNAAGRFKLILENLEKRDLILVINEAHHMGPRCLNLLKTLINRTRIVVVLCCIPALLHRLVNTSYEEAIQLFGNRLCENVSLPTPPEDEIALLLQRRGVTFDTLDTRDAAVKKIAKECTAFGNWSFVVKVCRQLRKTPNLNLKQFAAAFTTVLQRCGSATEQSET